MQQIGAMVPSVIHIRTIGGMEVFFRASEIEAIETATWGNKLKLRSGGAYDVSEPLDILIQKLGW